MTSNGEITVSTKWARSAATWASDITASALPDLTEHAVEHLRRFKTIAKTNDSVTLACRMNFKTWGGKLTLRFAQGTESSTVESRWEPVFGSTIIDWGQGESDTRQVWEAIDLAAASRA
jgi:hypothetical protein